MAKKKEEIGLPYNKDMIYLMQSNRQDEFPNDRIAFFRDFGDEPTDFMWQQAKKDMECFHDYEKRAITLEQLCSRVAKNNFLDRHFKGESIPKNMMLNELRIMGWETYVEDIPV